MNRALRAFKYLLGLEALLNLSLGLAALNLPGGLIRFLSQAPIGSAVGWMDVVLLVRIVGGLFLALAFFFSVVATTARNANAASWCAGSLRGILGLSRWWLLLPAGGGLAFLGWVDVIMGGMTLFSLLRLDEGCPPVAAISALRRKLRLASGTILLLLLVAASGAFWLEFMRAEPARPLNTSEEHFKYGSIGNEKSRGLPLYIFEALPEAFPDKLPGGWQALGFRFEPGHAAPIGFSERTVGFPAISPNCALCHSGTYRTAAGEPAQLAPGAPAAQLDFHAFLNVLFACGADPRFTDGTLLDRIRARHPLSKLDSAAYKYVLLPALAQGLQVGQKDFEWMRYQPVAGPGRMDAAALLKFNILRLPYDGAISISSTRNLWRQREGYTKVHRWSGGGRELAEENMLAAGLLLVLQPGWLDASSFTAMTNYFATLRPPKFPLPINEILVRKGEAIFHQECAECHAPDGAAFNRITSLKRLGVDRE